MCAILARSKGVLATSMGTGPFDAAVVKRQFPGLADPQLHYLDSVPTAQMPEAVLHALRRFEIEARANVHEGMHQRARAATDAYHESACARCTVHQCPV
jgi:cysteine desulfurase / selenocysteine lyase